MTVHGADHHITLVSSPGIAGAEQQGAGQGAGQGSELCRLLTNSANEALHWLLKKIVITEEEAEARRERLKVFYPQVPDTAPVLRELLSRAGLLAALARTSHQRLTQEVDMDQRYGALKHTTVGAGWLTVQHFWGEETYTDTGFLEANEGFVSPDLISTLGSSGDEAIKLMFSCPLNTRGKLVFAAEEAPEGEEEAGRLQHPASAQQTAGARWQHFLAQLTSEILAATPHFVICLDQAGSRDLPAQLETFNIKELNFVRRNGFCHRLTFAELLQRYCFLAFQYDER